MNLLRFIYTLEHYIKYDRLPILYFFYPKERYLNVSSKIRNVAVGRKIKDDFFSSETQKFQGIIF